jgi:hypothetical protein
MDSTSSYTITHTPTSMPVLFLTDTSEVNLGPNLLAPNLVILPQFALFASN